MRQLLKHILPAALAALVLIACSKEDLEPDEVKVSPTFSASIEGARSRAYETSWEAGDKIGINSGDVFNNCYITNDGDGHFTVTDKTKHFIFENDEPVKFCAYYPYNSTPTTTKPAITFTVSQANKNLYDYLWAEAEGSKIDNEVKFTFTHKMSKISFEFANGKDMDISYITKYSTKSFILKGTFNTTTGACASSGSTTVEVASELTNVREGVTAASFIVPPQTLKSNPATVTLTATEANAGTIIARLLFDGGKVESGKHYHFVITVNKTELTVAPPTITDWNEYDQGEIEAS